MKRFAGQTVAGMFRPFDQRRAFLQRFFEPEFVEFARILDAVQIVVAHRQPGRFVGLDERESRTWHVFRHGKGPQDGARQRGLSGTQIALQRDRVADGEACGNPRTQPFRSRKVGKNDRHCEGLRFRVHGCRSNG